MKCREALKLLYDYLDNQLDQKTVRGVQEHLNECKHCFETYQFEEHLNNFVKKKSAGDYSTAVDALKHKVMHRIDELAGRNEQREGPPRFFVFRPAFAAGFFAVIAIISLIFYFSYSDRHLHAKLFEPFLEDHHKAIAGLIEMDAVSDDLKSIDSCLRKKMSLSKSMLVTEGDCHLIKSKVTEDSSQPGKCRAHLVYRIEDHDASIFVMPRDCYTPPGNLEKLQDFDDIYSCRAENHSLLVWNCQKYWYVAVGKINDEGLVDFVSHLQ